jgi:hypothetical protein
VKHLLATLAIAFPIALVALGAARSAGAAGKPGYSCPPGFIGPLTLQQYLDLRLSRSGPRLHLCIRRNHKPRRSGAKPLWEPTGQRMVDAIA